jgi:hypothetical protein
MSAEVDAPQPERTVTARIAEARKREALAEAEVRIIAVADRTIV